jgi:ATP-dependent DNA helicase RecQ
MPSYGLRGNIPIDLRAEEGRALCMWRDAGWGRSVAQGKYVHGRFADDLVDACCLLFERWNPQPKPMWLTCIPSLRHPILVPDFAQRLASKLGLRFYPVLAKTHERPEQKTMSNSIQQARNVDGSLTVNSLSLPAGSVLLIDDMVDSRWTMTVGAWLLRKHGAAEVFPLALALTSRG